MKRYMFQIMTITLQTSSEEGVLYDYAYCLYAICMHVCVSLYATSCRILNIYLSFHNSSFDLHVMYSYHNQY